MKMKCIPLNIQEDYVAGLDEIARANECSRNSLVRLAIRRFIEENADPTK